MSLESHLQSLLLLAAPLALPSIRFFRRNIGKAKYGEHTVRFGIPGQCDLYAIGRGGKLHLEVELKNVGKTLNQDQKAWRDWCLEWEVPHIVLKALKDETDVQTIERWLEELRSTLRAML